MYVRAKLSTNVMIGFSDPFKDSSLSNFQIASYFFHSLLQLDCGLTCPAGVTVVFKEFRAIPRSICCCTSTVSKYVPYIIQGLICCMCTANVILVVEQIHLPLQERRVLIERGCNHAERGCRTCRYTHFASSRGAFACLDLMKCAQDMDTFVSKLVCPQKRKGIIM